MERGDDALTLTDAQGNTQRVDLIDLDKVRLSFEITPTDSPSQLLIDINSGNNARQKQGKIKLRKGLHRITIPYWQADGPHKLGLYVSGPGMRNRTKLDSRYLRCFRDRDEKADASAGNDKQGYRLPELGLETADNRQRMLNGSRYQLYVAEAQTVPSSVRSLAGMKLQRSGTASVISTGILNEFRVGVGIVFDAYFKADEDGEYQFTLLSDDGSQLYFGQVEDFTSGSLNEPPVHAPWQADLAHNGVALGQLKHIADETLTFHLPLVSDMTMALSHTRSLWDREADRDAINRENEPGNQDTVYLRDKNDPELIRSVSGKIIGLDDESLTFEFRGQARSITRDRVVGMVFKHDSRPTPTAPDVYQVIETQGGQVLPSRVRFIGDHLAFEPIGGGLLTPPREVVKTMRVESGRRIDLTRLAPNAEETIPYFGLKLPYKVNTNFSGKPIVLYDEKTYARGLAVHSKSRLHYKLNPNCERFQATFGLMNPGGKLGNVQARVLGDGKVLWEQSDITAATKPIDLDVPLKGIERLILEVDFGKGQDVGDRAAWADRYDATANNHKLLPTALPAAIPKTGRDKRTAETAEGQNARMPLGILTFEGRIDEPIKLRIELNSAAGGVQAHWPKDAKVGREMIQWESLQEAEDGQRSEAFGDQGGWLAGLRDSDDRLWLRTRDTLRKERFLLYDTSFGFKPAIGLELADGQYRLKTEPPRQPAPPITLMLRKTDAGWSSDTLTPPWPSPNPAIAGEAPSSAEPSLRQALAPIKDLLTKRGYNEQEVQLALGMIASAGFDQSRFSLVYVLPDGVIDEHIQLKIKPEPDQIVRTAIVVVNNVDPDLGSRVNSLIDDLGSDHWIKRDHAQRELTALGQAAIKKIQPLRDHEDPEVAFRARQILEAYEWKMNDGN
eukprot:g15525.t1